MADKRCDNGHFIDESWDICPYCPQDRRVQRPAAAAAAAPVRARTQAAPSTSGAERSGIRLVPAPEPPPQHTTVAPRADAAAEPAVRRHVVGWLVGLTGTARGESFAVRMGRNVLGRAPKSDVVIADDQASSHHAEEQRFILMDHNSTNGTFVNGEEISPRRDLRPRDIIRIGKQKYMFIPLCDETFSWNEGDAPR